MRQVLTTIWCWLYRLLAATELALAILLAQRVYEGEVKPLHALLTYFVLGAVFELLRSIPRLPKWLRHVVFRWRVYAFYLVAAVSLPFFLTYPLLRIADAASVRSVITYVGCGLVLLGYILSWHFAEKWHRRATNGVLTELERERRGQQDSLTSAV